MNSFLKSKLIPVLISVILFVIPFFWLKPGWMDLGGDSSRLYFYDPLNYLNSLSFYGVTPDGIGSVITGHFLLPFVLLVLLLKTIFQSSYLVITFFNSMTLTISFISIYLITKTFLDNLNKDSKDKNLSSCIAGLFYVFSPALAIIGWEKALTVHNQFFLNPLLFLFLLKYIHTQKKIYLLSSILISFLFAPNFSPSPYSLSFFPLAAVFLIIYAVKIAKVRINFKEIGAFFMLFLIVHLFHLLPMFLNFFSQNSQISKTAFSEEGKLVRGLSYFIAISKTTMLTNNLFGLPQDTKFLTGVNALWLIFPLSIIMGAFRVNFLQNQIYKKFYFLLFLFFLITLYLDTANITNVGLNIYKTFFYIPGFSMFRNFWAQFGHLFIFFYTILLGQSLFIIFHSLKQNKFKVIIFTLMVLAIAVRATPFIKGNIINSKVNSHPNREIKIPIVMDKKYEKVLDYIRKEKTEAKYLTLPLTDSAYQILEGEMGGAYMGPSTIAYLTGKKDFSGMDDFLPFQEIFIELIGKKDYKGIQELLSIFNIKFIFLNSDEKLYSSFPKYPYDFMRNSFPTIDSYSQVIENLDVKEKYKLGNFILYEINDKYFLPRFYVPTQLVKTQNVTLSLPYFSSNFNFAKDRIIVEESETDPKYINAKKIDIYKRIIKDFPIPVAYPFAKWELVSIIYPLILIKENYSLNQDRNNKDTFTNKVLFYNSKRISEMTKWEKDIPVLGNMKSIDEIKKYYKIPKGIFDYFSLNNYNSWESFLSRYAQGLEGIIAVIENPKNNLAWQYEKKSGIEESLKNNKILVNIIINRSKRPPSEKKYLINLTDSLFSYYLNKFKVKEYNPSVLEYVVNGTGSYEIYVHKNSENEDLSKLQLTVGDNSYFPSSYQPDNSWIRYEGINLNRQNLLTLHIPRQNIVTDSYWEQTSNIAISNSSASATLQTIKLENRIEGFVKHINNFEDNSHYLLSFDYLTHGDTFEFSLYTKKKPDKAVSKNPPYLAQFHENRNTREWNKFNLVFSSKNLQDVVVSIKPIFDNIADETPARTDIKDFSIIKLPMHPGMIAKKVEDNPKALTMPRIVFQKINPTKYKVKVEGATNPYNLVFQEAFDNGWKVYLSDKKNNGKIVKSYFNGDIMQLESKNIFLNYSTFETWNKSPIADQKHFIANGYANAWNIAPTDVGGRKDYELIIELQNQKIFYITLLVSITAVAICFTILAWSFLKK